MEGQVVDFNMTRMEGKQAIPVPKGEYTMTQAIDGYDFSQDYKNLFTLTEVEVETSRRSGKLKVDGDFP
jgi:hypothetical protein